MKTIKRVVMSSCATKIIRRSRFLFFHERDMPKGLLSGLIKDASLTYDEFIKLL
jgi:hypothetical protein